jgi:hypothetical protein
MSIFTKILDQGRTSGSSSGVLRPGTTDVRDWFRDKAREIRSVKIETLIRTNPTYNRTIVKPGFMYLFQYDPKHKETLPYYDRFPLVIPIESYKDGFLGLNLHYIHPKQRLILLDKLSETATNNNFDSKTKLRVNYSYLAGASRAFEATPCIKRYLYSHIQSRFLEISADEWDIAAMLPVETFVGATTSKVYADSRKKF